MIEIASRTDGLQRPRLARFDVILFSPSCTIETLNRISLNRKRNLSPDVLLDIFLFFFTFRGFMRRSDRFFAFIILHQFVHRDIRALLVESKRVYLLRIYCRIIFERLNARATTHNAADAIDSTNRSKYVG